MRIIAVLLITLSFTLTGCQTICKYKEKEVMQEKAADSEVKADTASGS
ncbi:MAG: hypothetical protein HY809_07325 [Nitrospirae bacterium]|nr:hypothetical protein [Nitrospirota bacterium]